MGGVGGVRTREAGSGIGFLCLALGCHTPPSSRVRALANKNARKASKVKVPLDKL